MGDLEYHIIPKLYSLLGVKIYQPAAGLISTCPQTELKDHSASLCVTCDQNVESTAIVDFLEQDSR